jgi:hypothetical protein
MYQTERGKATCQTGGEPYVEENLTWRRTLREATNACGESLPGRVAISWEKGWSDDKDKDRRRPTKDIYAEKATIT